MRIKINSISIKDASVENKNNNIMINNQEMFFTCPVCNIYIEKYEGCNKINCLSVKCNGNTIICGCCRKILYESDFKIHFPNGFYSNCINLITI